MHEPTNNITFSQKFINDVRANKTRSASDLQIDKPVRTPTTRTGWMRATYENDRHDEENKE